MAKLLKRESVKAEDSWKLEDLYAGREDWERDYRLAFDAAGEMEKAEGKLADREALRDFFAVSDAAFMRAERLYAYARMRRDEDNGRAEYQALADRAQGLLIHLGSAAAFLEPELIALGEEALGRLAADPAFADHDAQLRDLSRRAPHTLSAAEEKLVAMAGELIEAPSTAYELLTGADMVFPEIEGEMGEKLRLTQANFVPTLQSRNARLRRDAFEAFYKTFSGYSASIPSLYASSVKGDIFLARTGKFASCLDAALFPDVVPASVYEGLVAAVRGGVPRLTEYLRTNARLIGLDKPGFQDLYVPAAEGFSLNLGFRDAYALTVDCLAPLGEEYQALLRSALDGRWLDPFENEGKSAGAYSWGAYGAHPFVLLNYHENLDGLLTIAHEMGHAMHSHFSGKSQPYPKADYSLFVAEVASTVNEVLVLTELMERYKADEKARAYLLNNLLEAFRTTVFRQTMFAEFEKEAHALAEKGEALTAENLNALYLSLLEAYYPEVEKTEGIQWEWMRIPHFYRAFYVYKYATGFAAAAYLARAIRREGGPAVERYRRFLSAGCSVYPLDALKLAGVDMSDGAPVAAALDWFGELTKEYAELTGR